MVIEVGPSRHEISHRFQVASQVVTGQSAKLRMIFQEQGFKTGREALLNYCYMGSGELPRVYLDDRTPGVDLLLKVLHHQQTESQRAPPSLRTLIQLAELCRKYWIHNPLVLWGPKLCLPYDTMDHDVLVWNMEPWDKLPYQKVGFEDWLLLISTFPRGLTYSDSQKFRYLIERVLLKLVHTDRLDGPMILNDGHKMSSAYVASKFNFVPPQA